MSEPKDEMKKSKTKDSGGQGATPDHPIKDVRRASVPLVLYETADPAQTMRTVLGALNSTVKDVAIMQHDVVRGLVGLNAKGTNLASEVGGKLETVDPTSCLDLFHDKVAIGEQQDAGRRSILFMHQAQAWLSSPPARQAVWNLRDPFAAIGATLILLSNTSEVPAELRQDVIVLNDPLPTPAEIAEIVTKIASSAKDAGAEVDPDKVKEDGQIHDTLTGLSGFGVRQVFSMSLRKTGIVDAVLSDRKRKLVEQTKGLSIWTGGETFDQLAGLANLKRFLTGLLTSGATPVRAIGYLDEIEKMLAGAGSDTSGTSQDQLGVILRVMQDQNTPGIILVGPPGTGKSAIAKASGRIANAPVVSFDLGAAKGSLVGSSEAAIRAMMSVFQAVSQGKGLFIATCNGLQSLPPELRRRFKLGIFYVDLPDAEERAAIWPIYIKRFGLDPALLDGKPDDNGWTGAEVASCCEIAFRLGCTLAEASKYVVPVCKSAADTITNLRKLASGKFISAGKPGIYQFNPGDAGADKGRALSFD